MVFEKKNGFSILKALKNSTQGIQGLWHNEKAFRIEIYCSILLAPLILMLHIPALIQLILVLLLLFLLLVEAINSAIEAVVDRISLEIHDQSRLAKDMSSAAVGIAILMNILMWIFAIYLHCAHIH